MARLVGGDSYWSGVTSDAIGGTCFLVERLNDFRRQIGSSAFGRNSECKPSALSKAEVVGFHGGNGGEKIEKAKSEDKEEAMIYGAAHEGLLGFAVIFTMPTR